MEGINDAFPSKYIKASDLKGRALAVTIEHVTEEKIGNDSKAVVYFQHKEKGLVLNKTNATRIAELVGSGMFSDWHGAQIAIFPTTTDYQGKTVDCIRIRAVPPNQRPAAAPKPEPHDDPITDDEVPF